MIPSWIWSLGNTPAWLLVTAHVALQVFFVGRAVLRPHREPASRLAWVVVIIVAPVVGMLAYVLFGETNIGRRRIARLRAAMERLPPFAAIGRHTAENEAATVPQRYMPLFRVGQSISFFPVVDGNRGKLLGDSDDVIDHIVRDVEAAERHVHICFYIWLADNNGLKVVEALKRAAGRGVVCRAMADDLGSRAMVRSEHWRAMAAAGVRLAVALPIGNILARPLKGRVDMRNHRKIVVIDNRITYCGSNNCADAAFAIKPKFAPWVDAMIRFEGPIVRQNQHVFATDWMSHVREDLSPLFEEPLEVGEGFPAQVIATGANVRYSAMPEMFESLMYAARRELVITTPYYVPDEPIQAALCASARRGVQTTVVFPAKNDSWIVAAASRSYYAQLLDAGVVIYEYVGGLLHTKSMTIDGELTLIGSANIDRRSFELNFENNILFVDRPLTGAMRKRQASYIDSARLVEAADVAAWSRGERMWNNTIAMLGPVL